VKDLPADAEDAAITKAIIAMAHSLKLEVVAEGVETTEQLAFLQEHGCDLIQGFLFSRPVPAADIPQMLSMPTKLRAAGGG
jgi:EAL domain-containing protein (putative c-di-GMP-specific phosphodiesterase class I)